MAKSEMVWRILLADQLSTHKPGVQDRRLLQQLLQKHGDEHARFIITAYWLLAELLVAKSKFFVSENRKGIATA